MGTSKEWTLERLKTVAAILAAQHSITGEEQEPQKDVLPGQSDDQEHSPRPPTNAMMHMSENGTASEIVKRPASTLLLPLTSLVGREREVAAVCTLLARPLECLTASGELERTRHVHAQYYLRFVEEGESHLFGAEQASWFDQLEREHTNLCAALRWSIERAGEEKAEHRIETA